MSMSSPKDSAQQERPRKLQRISQACDLCHRRSIRCRPATEEGERCQNCYDFDVPCTYDRPSKRRKHPQAPNAPQQSPQASSASSSSRNQTVGPGLSFSNPPPIQPASAGLARSSIDLVNGDRSGDQTEGGNAYLITRPGTSDEVSVAWKAFVLSSEATITELLDIYLEIIYPLYPLFHVATLKKRMRNRDHLTDRGFFASIMGACALTSARIRDGAAAKSCSESLHHPEVATEIFFSAARDAMAKDLTKNEGFDYLRACTLLALTSIQYGQLGAMQQYMGQFFTLAAMQRFYDEKHWRQGLTKVQIELRRRIYWCTYTLDVYSAATWNCFLRSQEIHANVRYPGDIDNEFAMEITLPQEKQPKWLQGWNFATDLYRVLEHTLNKARAKKFHHEDRRSVDHLVFADTFSDEKVMTVILQLYHELPSIFKETPPMCGDIRKDIYGYQAANIQATLQLLRMILFSMEDGPGIDRKCEVASEVLSVFHTIPREYLRAISTPLIYHLGSIGQVLASVIDQQLSEQQYQRVRSSLLSMADLLDGLEAGLARAAGASQGLRQQVEKLDDSMRTKRRLPQPVLMQPVGHHNLGTAAPPLPPTTVPHSGPSDFQLPPELFGDWSWPPDFGQDGQYYGNWPE